ncbi:calcium-dependent phosphotriesterase [Xylariaceae sp. FL1019]|nr:calcium-dependent phosphotriesterase [Xylariaceae sp. FL1019]
MASVTKDTIITHELEVEAYTPEPELEGYGRTPPAPNADTIVARSYHPAFLGLFNKSEVPIYALLLSSADSSQNPLFHSGFVYLHDQDQLYTTSDLLQSGSSSLLPVVLISRITFSREMETDIGDVPTNITTLEWMKLRPPANMPMPADAVSYKQGILYCSQGTLEPNTGGLYYMPIGKRPVPIVTNFYGRPFNSIQSVVVDGEGALWFVDSDVGYEREFRPKPQLPNYVYCLQPETATDPINLRVVADGFQRPIGIAMSPNGSVLYVADRLAAKTGDHVDSATIYAFDVVRTDHFMTNNTTAYLTNKRVFAVPTSGIPAAIKCNPGGFVYAACPGGLESWMSDGVPFDTIRIPGGCSSLTFGRHSEFFVGSERNLWYMRFRSRH